MTDNGLAALAAALVNPLIVEFMEGVSPDRAQRIAVAILAALPDEWGWREGYAENMNRLLQSNLDYSAEIDRQAATIATLRAALDGLVPFVELRPVGHTGLNHEIPWFQHGGISHGADYEGCLACAALAAAKETP